MDFEIDLGKVGITPAGAWSNTTDYERLTMVTWRGQSYVSKAANRAVEPGTNSNVWLLVAEKGADGQGGSGGGDSSGTTDIGVARYSDGILYWTKNGVWLLDENGNKVKAEGVNGKDGKDGKDGSGSGDGSEGVAAAFKSMVFKRASSNPGKPSGGTYDNPVPEGWYDGIPAGDLQVWVSSRWFYSDDALTALTDWTVPVSTTDTADIEYMFSASDYPGTPETNRSVWHDDAQEGDKYMAIQVTRNGVPQPWSVVKIVGEQGPQGPQGPAGSGAVLNILGSYDTLEEAQTANPDPNRGDACIIDGTLYIWDGDSWADIGVESTIWVALSGYYWGIKGDTDAATNGETITFEVYGYRGQARVATGIGMITGMPSGMTATVNNENTDHTSITFTASNSLVTRSGSITIPVSADGETLNQTVSWVLNLTGATGAAGAPGATGSDGYNSVTLPLYKRSASNPSSSMPGNVTYNFSSDSISSPANGWQRTPPESNGNPLWMVQGSGSTRSNTVTITSWAGPIKFVEDGLRGKTMRGPSNWVAGMDYQGTGNQGDFVDFVYYNGNYATLYYCKQNHRSSDSNHPPIAPITENDYWVASTVQEFIATKLFYSQLGYVENLGVNNLKVGDSGSLVGGFMPPYTSYDPNNPNTNNGNVILWVGGTPSNATFSVDKYGNGKFGPFISNSNGFTYSNEEAGSSGQGESEVTLHYNKLGLNLQDQPGTVSFEASSSYSADAVVEINIGGYGSEVDKPALLIDSSYRGNPGEAIRIDKGYVTILDGVIQGLRPAIRVAQSTNFLQITDHTLIIPAGLTSSSSVTLPSPAKEGQEYIIANFSNWTTYISSPSATYYYLSNNSNCNANSAVKLVYTGGAWYKWDF